MRLSPGTYRFKNTGSSTLDVKVDNIECKVLAGDTVEFTCNDIITFTENSSLLFGKSTPTAVIQQSLDSTKTTHIPKIAPSVK